MTDRDRAILNLSDAELLVWHSLFGSDDLPRAMVGRLADALDARRAAEVGMTVADWRRRRSRGRVRAVPTPADQASEGAGKQGAATGRAA